VIGQTFISIIFSNQTMIYDDARFGTDFSCRWSQISSPTSADAAPCAFPPI
jgi:hypothetical protein